MLVVLSHTAWLISHSTTIASTTSHSLEYDAQPWIPKPPPSSSSLPELSTESSSLSLSSSSSATVDAPLLVQSAADRAALLREHPVVELGTPGAPPCIVALENKADYHYEVIESTILRYPLPWHRLNCSTSTVIVFDVALAELNSLYKNAHANGSSVSKTSFARYFNTSLAGTIRRRSDGTLAQFGRMVRYTAHDRNYHAMIGISCDSVRLRFLKWMTQGPHKHFCVLHGICMRCTPPQVAPDTRQVCWVSPLEPACHFPTVDLPQFDTTPIRTINHQNHKNTITLCPSGTKKQTALVHALNQLVQEEEQLQQGKTNHSSPEPTFRVLLHSRSSGLPPDYAKTVWGPDRVSVVQHDDYVDFQRSIATQCHILVPLVDPETTPQYFGLTQSKLTGFVSQAAAYRIPAVVHADLQRIYQRYWTAPVLTYTNTSTAQFAPHTTALDTPELRHLIAKPPNSTTSIKMPLVLKEPERTLTQALREMIQRLQQQ